MAVSRDLSRFVREALVAGRSREEIAEVLAVSGWSPTEIHDALQAWSETPFTPPVPRPEATVTARDFFFYALMFGLLLIGAIHLVILFHALIDIWIEEPQYRSSSSIRWAMAVLIVAAPLFLWMTVRERRGLAEDPAVRRSAVRSMLIYLTLLASAAVLLGDLISVIYGLLSGELTLQFLLKALVVAVVAGFIFLYYRTDAASEQGQ